MLPLGRLAPINAQDRLRGYLPLWVYNILYFNPAMEQLRRDVQAQQEKAIQADLDRGMVVNRQLQQSGQEPEFNGMISLVGLLPVMVYGLMLLVIMFLPDVSASFPFRRS